jgi:hypothetical protein
MPELLKALDDLVCRGNMDIQLLSQIKESIMENALAKQRVLIHTQMNAFFLYRDNQLPKQRNLLTLQIMGFSFPII